MGLKVYGDGYSFILMCFSCKYLLKLIYIDQSEQREKFFFERNEYWVHVSKNWFPQLWHASLKANSRSDLHMHKSVMWFYPQLHFQISYGIMMSKFPFISFKNGVKSNLLNKKLQVQTQNKQNNVAIQKERKMQVFMPDIFTLSFDTF